jgi:predicted nucleic acid-binding protein
LNAYFDSSIFLRLVLGEPGKLPAWKDYDLRITSDLAEVECLRTLDRLRIRHGLSQEEITNRREALYILLETTERIEICRSILNRASQTFPVELGTLDAIHLSTALVWRDEQESELVFATHDKALALAARSLGFKVAGA